MLRDTKGICKQDVNLYQGHCAFDFACVCVCVCVRVCVRVLVNTYEGHFAFDFAQALVRSQIHLHTPAM